SLGKGARLPMANPGGKAITVGVIIRRPRVALPSQFEPKLYLPLTGLRGARKRGGSWSIAFAIEYLCFRLLKIRVVKEVKEFSPKLQPHSFTPQGPVFEKGKVKLLQAWTAQGVASNRSVRGLRAQVLNVCLQPEQRYRQAERGSNHDVFHL